MCKLSFDQRSKVEEHKIQTNFATKTDLIACFGPKLWAVQVGPISQLRIGNDSCFREFATHEQIEISDAAYSTFFNCFSIDKLQTQDRGSRTSHRRSWRCPWWPTRSPRWTPRWSSRASLESKMCNWSWWLVAVLMIMLVVVQLGRWWMFLGWWRTGRWWRRRWTCWSSRSPWWTPTCTRTGSRIQGQICCL